MPAYESAKLPTTHFYSSLYNKFSEGYDDSRSLSQGNFMNIELARKRVASSSKNALNTILIKIQEFEEKNDTFFVGSFPTSHFVKMVFQ